MRALISSTISLLSKVTRFSSFDSTILATPFGIQCCGALYAGSASFNSNRASVAKIGRTTYTRLYPTMLVQPDGSTINIRYKEPRKIITLPFDASVLTEDELRLRMLKRKPKMKIKSEEEIDDGFDAGRYLQPKRRKQ